MGGWIGGICVDIKEMILSRLTDGQDNGLLIRLCDLVDAAAC